MKTYIAVVEQDGDSAWGLWFPDVEGCFSAADNQADIVKNAIEALTLHLDGMEHPVAHGIQEVAKNPQVAVDLREGAYLLGIPFVTTEHKQVRANISMDKGTLRAIDDAANLRGLTRSAFIAEAAMNEIQGR